MRQKGPHGRWLSVTELPPNPLPPHMTNERGEVIDLDKMLRALHLAHTDFNGAPSHAKPSDRETNKRKARERERARYARSKSHI